MVETVVKVGGGLLAHAADLARVLDAIARGARVRPLLVVPGGGPFADAVRIVDRRLGLSDTAAHWMAILAMDQYAHCLASRMTGGTVVMDACEIDPAIDAQRVPVLAPYRWLKEVDPLPHSWDVTSDAIAAWIAGELHATDLVLVKPPFSVGADPRVRPGPTHGSAPTDVVRGVAADRGLLDAYFSRALPAHVKAVVVAADDTATIEATLSRGA